MNSFRNYGAGIIITWLVVTIIIGWGWVLNIIDLLAMPSVTTGEGALRIIGIFIVPLGTIMGYFF